MLNCYWQGKAPQSFRAGKAECLIPGICSESFAYVCLWISLCQTPCILDVVRSGGLVGWKVQVSWLVIFVGILGCWLNMLNSGGYTQNWHGLSARNYLDCIPDLHHENQRNAAGITIPPPAAAFSIFPSFLTLSPGLAVQLGHGEPSCNSPGELRIVMTIHFTDSPPRNKACLQQYLPAFHVWSLSNYLEVHFQLLWVNLVYIIYIYI